MAGPRLADQGGFEDPVDILLQDNGNQEAPPMTNTTIGLVATNAGLTKEEVNHLAGLSHDGLALTIRPCHTLRDGDTMFAMATGRGLATADLTALGAASVEVTARAVLRAVETATGLGGVPSISEIAHG